MEDVVVRSISRLIVPFIQLYGLYIIFYGHLSPGGGFAGGAIIASSMIFYGLCFDPDAGPCKISHRVSSYLESGGGLWFLFLGFLGILLGSNFLANQAAGFSPGIPGQFLSGGIIALLSVGIGVKVASTMTTLFFSLSTGEDSSGNNN